MDTGRNGFAPAHFGRDNNLALVLGLDGQQPGAGDIGIQKCKVAAKGRCAGQHFAPLRAIGHQVHVGARIKIQAPTAGVQVDHNIRERK